MALQPGTLLGNYQVISSLGAGGMGEVYRARDTKLGREVAVKLLLQGVATDPERLARFEREARLLASLNHPNIATLHGFECEGDTSFLVMELVEGETLADRIARGPVPIEDAIPLLVQIAEGLEAAHEKGVVHRDLKPANVVVSPDGQVKLLDFGLAKACQAGPARTDENPLDSPTLTARMTELGAILGTAGYMSPEQAKGQEADQRSDIWSFGVLMYEMLAGRRPFVGPTHSEALAAVLTADVDWDALPEKTPSSLRRVLRRCIERDRKRRLHSAADARLELEEAAGGSVSEAETTASAATSTRVGRKAAAAAVVVAFALIAWGLVMWSRAAETPPIVRALVSPPPGSAFFLESGRPGAVAVSPDGAWLAFSARGPGGIPHLWIRGLEDSEPRVLPGTDGALYPFWSPDSRSLAFINDEGLHRSDIAGGPPRALCDGGGRTGGSGTWNQEGVILIAGRNLVFYRVDASGKGCKPLIVSDTTPGERGRHPRFFPDGRRFLYLAELESTDSGEYPIMIGSLDGMPPPQELLRNGSQVEIAGDHLWFVHQDTLVARPFDARRGLITGEELPITEGVGELRQQKFGLFSVSPSGVLAFHGPDSAEKRSLVWRDRSGQTLGTLGPPARHIYVRLSPDGAHAATNAYEDAGFFDVWLYETATGNASQFTFGSSGNGWPIWSPDGDRLAFSTPTARTVEVRPAFGGANGYVLWKAEPDDETALYTDDWSPDGSLILATSRTYSASSSGDQHDTWVVPLDPEKAASPLRETPFNEFNPALSPDGRWLAYSSDESGRFEVYVTAFPDRGRQWKLSSGGGEYPKWGRRGDELFYLDSTDGLVAVPVDLKGGSFDHGSGAVLFHTRLGRRVGDPYSASGDGQRFLLIETQENDAPSQIHLLVGWKQLLEARRS